MHELFDLRPLFYQEQKNWRCWWSCRLDEVAVIGPSSFLITLTQCPGHVFIHVSRTQSYINRYREPLNCPALPVTTHAVKWQTWLANIDSSKKQASFYVFVVADITCQRDIPNLKSLSWYLKANSQWRIQNVEKGEAKSAKWGPLLSWGPQLPNTFFLTLSLNRKQNRDEMSKVGSCTSHLH